MKFHTFGKLVGWAFIALSCLFMVAPLIVLMGASLNEANRLAFPPVDLSFDWYIQVLSNPVSRSQLISSLTLAAGAATVSLILGIMAAFILGRSRKAWASAMTSFFLSPLVVPQVVIGAALLQYYAMLDIAGGQLGLFIGHVIITVPYVIRSVVGAIAGVDGSLMEASRDLGSNRFQTLGSVVFPLIKKAAVGAWLFAFVMSWINVEVSIFIAPGNLTTVPVEIFNQIQYSATPIVAALSSISALLALVLIIIIDRFTDIESISR